MTHIPPVKIVKASAGSGKTFNLTAHYLSLLFRENSHFSQILAITFTNKATAEMKHRILSVLESLAKDDGKFDAYRQFLLSVNPALTAQEISAKAKLIYRQILHRYSLFSVTTIDGFIQKIIRSFTYELEIGASYRLEMNMDKVKKDLAARLNQVLNHRPDLLQWIIQYAREQIEQGRQWNYTHTLLDLANEIFKEPYQPFHTAINLLKPEDRATTFETIDQINREVISTFEQRLQSSLLTAKNQFLQHPVEIADFVGKSRNLIPKLAELTESSDFISFFEKLISYIDQPEKWIPKTDQGAVQAVYQSVNPLLKELLSFYQQESPAYFLAQALKENLYYLRLLQEMSLLLRDYRDDHGVMLISESTSLLKELNKTGVDNASFIWEKIGTHFRHLLFDEFQDTSSNQWNNFVPLLLNMLAERDPENSLADHLLVGDVKQSIYRWRSGDWTLLDKKAAIDLGKQLITEHSLQENYRSLDKIIDFNNFLFKRGPAWLQDELNNKVRSQIGEEAYRTWWQQEGLDRQIIQAYETSFQEKPRREGPSRGGGKVTVSILPVEKGNRSSRQNQTKELALTRASEQLLAWIRSRKYLPGQIGILVRTNQEAQEVVEHLLAVQATLPSEYHFNVISGEALLLANNRSIKLLIYSLQAMVFNQDEAAIYKASCVRVFQQIARQLDFSPDLWLHLDHPDIHVWGKSLPQQIQDQWDQMQLFPLSELIEFLIQGYGLDQLEEDIPFLLAFKDLIEQFSALGQQGIWAFLTYWEEDGIKKALPSSEGADAVEVLTIHKSKGLAFDVVMIPFCSWNLDSSHLRNFWVNTQATSYELLQAVPVKYNGQKIGKSSLFKSYYEEMLFNYLDALNLLYVATTRTVCELYITAPGTQSANSASSIADLLIQVLSLFHDDLQVSYDQGLIFPEEEPSHEEKTLPAVQKITRHSTDIWKHENQWYWNIRKYPISGHLGKALTNQKIQADLLLMGEQDPNIRLGLILHELLSAIHSPQEIDLQLARMQAEGWVKGEEIPTLKSRAQALFANPDLNALFNKGYITLNEQAILDTKGQLFRPDKVLLGPDETILLDFKFTGKKEEGILHKEHLKQVREYRSLLQQMGYPNIKGYLFYAFFDTLVPVY